MRRAAAAVTAALGVGVAHRAGDDERGQTPEHAAGPARGEAKSKAPRPERAGPGATAPALVGHVVAVGTGTLSVRRDDVKVERLRVTKDTRIVREGKRVALSTIAPGTELRVGLAGGKGWVATQIDVGGGVRGTNAPLIEGEQEPVKEKARGERE